MTRKRTRAWVNAYLETSEQAGAHVFKLTREARREEEVKRHVEEEEKEKEGPLRSYLRASRCV